MDFNISGPGEMLELAAEFARNSKTNDVFGLVGTLGSGKTLWTKGFLDQIQPGSSATSPTFSLVNEYHRGTQSIYHLDFYRLESADELLALGWDEYLEDAAITICEWADLFPDLMPENTCWLQFEHQNDGSRRVSEIAKPTNPSVRIGY